MLSLEKLIEEAKEKAKKRAEEVKYDEEIIKERLGKYYNLFEMAMNAKNSYKKVKPPYFEIDFSSSHFAIWVIEEDKRRRVFGNAQYGSPTVRTLLALLSSYAKDYKTEWADLDELRTKASNYPKVRRSEITHILGRKWFKNIFEKRDEKIRIHYPIGNVKII